MYKVICVPYNFEPLESDANAFDYTHYEKSSVNYNGRSKLNVAEWRLCKICENQLSDGGCVYCSLILSGPGFNVIL